MFRTVLIHHPPVIRPEWHNERLLDGEAFLDVLKEHGAELVLYGHEHVHSLRWFDAPGRRVPAIGVPSASATLGGQYDRQPTISISSAGARRLAMRDGVPRLSREGIVELKRRVLIG